MNNNTKLSRPKVLISQISQTRDDSIYGSKSLKHVKRVHSLQRRSLPPENRRIVECSPRELAPNVVTRFTYEETDI